jgi:hypothetical protein
VQRRHDAGLGPGELTEKHLREQMVEAVPLPFVIEWHEEQVVTLDDFDDLRRVSRPSDGVAQRGAEPVEDGGPGHEQPDLLGLAAQYLLGQDSAMYRLPPVNWRTKAVGASATAGGATALWVGSTR